MCTHNISISGRVYLQFFSNSTKRLQQFRRRSAQRQLVTCSKLPSVTLLLIEPALYTPI